MFSYLLSDGFLILFLAFILVKSKVGRHVHQLLKVL